MTTPRSQRSEPLDLSSSPPSNRPDTPSRASRNAAYDEGPANSPNPTFATFSPTTLSSATPSATSAAKRRSTVLVHQKSPLLLATPPQITRALAYSHPFLLPLNKLVGLLSWTTGDPWESFILVCVWWGVVLYGDVVIRFAGPVVLVLTLIAGMYGRRYSPLSTSGWGEPGSNKEGASDAQPVANQTKTKGGYVKNKGMTMDGSAVSSSAKGNANNSAGGPGHQRSASSAEATNTRHQKTLDEIVETLKEFTSRCNILLEPLLELTDFLSTQITATSATTRPALTALFIRILLCTPFWFALTLPPWRIVTTRRVALVFGTLILTWHSRVMRVSRTIMWRSATVRRITALITGLDVGGLDKASSKGVRSQGGASLPADGSAAVKTAGRAPTPQESELTKAIRRAKGGHDAGVRFTFIIYENQRRWVGLGWTTSLFAYERGAWTDEHNNAVPPRDEFELPEVEDESNMRWRWVQGSRWRVDGVPDEAVKVVKPTGNGELGEKEVEWDYDGEGGRMGWIFYDNKWQNGRRGQDGWGRWTRRRKWYRDAELVEASDQTEDTTPTPPQSAPVLPPRPRSPSGSSTHARSVSSASLSMPNIAEHEAEKVEEDDAVSLMSTSPRSVRNMKGGVAAPSLRRRVTDSSRASGRSRRASEAASEDDAASLGTRVGLEIQGAGKEGWGIGDEARMGLE